MFDSMPFKDLLTGLGTYGIYLAGLAALWTVLGLGRRLIDRRSRLKHEAALAAGNAEPASLHPVIDPAKCIGCGACTRACPEGKILGLIDGKAKLLDPIACIGHGACKTSCPVDAIDLVFGSARRGVEIPIITPDFQSNVPGLFVAGELGGMGLIANAIEQGRQAMDAIAKLDGLGEPNVYDVIIVGGGPAGIAASLAAKERKLNALTFEQDTLGGTVTRYPRGKIVMTRPATLPLYGRFKLRRVRKEKLLDIWRNVIAKTGIQIYDQVRVERVIPLGYGFDVETSAGAYRTRAVLLATGRRGSPRKLGVPGEELAKVVYSLDDPRQYRDRHVLVVGGGDSALEAAAELARHQGIHSTLSYRGDAFTRAKPAARKRIEDATRLGRLTVLMQSHVRMIEPSRVIVDQSGRRHELRNDAVIVCVGGLLPTSLLTEIGVRVETKYGTA